MTITSERVQTFSFLHNACGIRSLSCMGNKRHLVRIDDTPATGPPGPGFFVQRYAISTDDGLTFEELPEQVSTFLPNGPMLALNFNTLLAGFGAGHASDPYSNFSLISRTADGGLTWVAAISPQLYSTLDPENSDIWTFANLGGGEVLAFGGVSPLLGGLRYHVLRSLDTGQTFALYSAVGTSPPSPLSIVDVAVYAGNSVVLVAGDFLGGSFPDVSIWRSTNKGQSWTEVALPSPGGFGSVASFASIGSGIVLAGGQVETSADPNHIQAVVWRSVDYGATWTAVVLPNQPFGTGGGVQRYTVTWIQPLTASKIVAGVSIFGAPPSVKHWRLSTDGGVTFPDAGVEEDAVLGTSGIVRQMSLADDGALLTAIEIGGAPHFAEIWRSDIDGFNGPGTCASTFQPGGGTEPPNGPCTTPFRNRLGACIDTLNDDDIIRGRWQGGDRLIINRVIFSIDWDHVLQQFTKHVVYTFGDSVKKYGLRPAMRIESKGIRSTPTPCGEFGTIGCALAMLDERAANLGARYADPPPMLNLEIFYRKHTWEPSDIICVTSAFVPNMIAGRRGIVNEAFEVVNIQQQFAPEGKILLTLLDVEAITLPEEPARTIPEDETELLALLREQQVYMTELPLRFEETRAQRRLVADFRRGKTQEGVAVPVSAVPRREVFAGVGRGTMPRVP